MPARDVYLAAPLFTRIELDLNESLCARLEDGGMSVFLPQRDGYEFSTLRDLTPEARARKIFELDTSMVGRCRAMVAVLDGSAPDDGVCVELGLAHAYRSAHGTPALIVGLRTDVRVWQIGSPLNPMVSGPLDQVFSDAEPLLDYVIAEITSFKRRHT